MAKKRTPEELARIKARKEFVQSNPELDPAEARKRYFVQTRVQELEKSGVEVTKERRAALRQKFASGDVQRAGFYTAGDLARYTGSGSNGGSTGGSNTPTVKQTGGYMDPTRGKDVAGFKAGQVQKSTKKIPGRFEKGGAFDKYMEKNLVAPIDRMGDATKKFRNKKGYIPVVSDVAWVGEQVTKFAKDTGGSLAATFTNPSINAAAGLFGKKPKLREAGVIEAAITTGGTILDISTLGGSKPLTTALTKSAQKASQSLLKNNMVAAATVASNVARKSKAAIEAAESLRMFPKVKGLDNLTSPTTKVSSKTKAPGQVGGVKFVKPAANQVVEKVKPVKKTKPVTAAKPVKATTTKETYVAPQMQGTPNAALQAQLQAQADNAIELGLKNTQVVANIKSEAAAQRTVFGPAGKPVVADPAITMPSMPSVAKPKVKKAAPTKKTAPTKKSVKLTPEEQPWTDKTPAPAGKEFKYPPSPWETRTQRQTQAGGAQVPKSLAEVKSAIPTPAATPKTRPVFRTAFKDQKDFNEFMASGGESVYKSQSLADQDKFIRSNRAFIDTNKKASAQRALAAKVNEAKRKAEVKAINEANGFVKTVVPKSQQALRQPVKKKPASKARKTKKK